MNRWYEDRDFPEIKASNADIVGVVPDQINRRRIIREHNLLVEAIHTAVFELRALKNGNEVWDQRIDAKIGRVLHSARMKGWV